MIELKAVGHLKRFMIGTGRTVLFKCQCPGRKEKLQWQKKWFVVAHVCGYRFTRPCSLCIVILYLISKITVIMPWCYRSHWHVLHEIHRNSQSLWARPGISNLIMFCFVRYFTRMIYNMGIKACANAGELPEVGQAVRVRISNAHLPSDRWCKTFKPCRSHQISKIHSLEIPRCCSLWMYVVQVWLASLSESHTGKAELLFSEMLAKGVGPNQKGFGSLAEGVLGSHFFLLLDFLTALPTPFQY